MTQLTKPTVVQNLVKVAKYIMAVASFFAVFGFMFKASTEWGSFKQNMEEVTFPSSEIKHNVIRHTSEVPNAVENYKAMQINKDIKVELDTLLGFVNAVFEDDRARQRIDSVNSNDAVVSRHKRDSINVKNRFDIDEIQREQKILSTTNMLILQKLGEIQDAQTN